ncbi:DUF4394 domain-containing protein [Baekduia sp. Peel2402]|uniref:DUF4394 domain-containing protein n=1 Tax=Baekduia sp. Peel2402 TaxID=3458296 RepID=UPI00403E4308
MTPSPQTSFLAVALAASALGAAVPTAASAADGFAGVTGGHRLITFHSDTIPAISEASDIAGLPGGERLVALDAMPTPSGALLGLGVTGTIYGIDAAHAKVINIAGGFGARLLPGTRAATLSVAPDGKTVRVIANGRDKTIDLTTRTIVNDVAAPYADVAADRGADGVLRGVDPTAETLVALDGTNANVLAKLPVPTPGATAVTTAADGASWILTGLPNRPTQSRLLRYNPTTGKLRQQSDFLFTRLNAIAATGTVADDTKAPQATVRIPTQSVKDALRRRGFLAIVTTNEPGQTVMSARLGTKYRGFGFATAERSGGELRVIASERQSSIRKLAGKRLRLHLEIHDWAGNTKRIDRYFTLRR